MTTKANDALERARALAHAGDFSADDLGGDIGTMSLRNPDGPALLAIVQEQADRIEALETELAGYRAPTDLEDCGE